MSHHPPSHRRPARRSGPEALLLVSAGALLACAAWAWIAGPVGALRGTPALADVAIPGAEHAAVTSDGGGDDILVIVDQRSEDLLLYRPVNGKTVDFKGRHALRQLFAEARANSSIVPLPEPERQPGAQPTPAPTPGSPTNPPR